jgi:hypothetical protein
MIDKIIARATWEDETVHFFDCSCGQKAVTASYSSLMEFSCRQKTVNTSFSCPHDALMRTKNCCYRQILSSWRSHADKKLLIQAILVLMALLCGQKTVATGYFCPHGALMRTKNCSCRMNKNSTATIGQLPKQECLNFLHSPIKRKG